MAFKKISSWIPSAQALFGGGGDKPTYKNWERSITDDGLVEVNFADAICDITTPGSGVFVNTDPGGEPPVNPEITNFKVLDTSQSKVKFAAGFQGGFDTVYDWVGIARTGVVYNPLDTSRNSGFVDGSNQLISDSELNQLIIKTDSTSADGTIYSWQSRNRIKLDDSGRTIIQKSGVFEHTGTTSNVFTFGITIRNIEGSLFTPQQNWNIDAFDGNGVSKIAIDFKKMQTLVMEFYDKQSGDIRFGFLIDNTVYYAHIEKSNNNPDLAPDTQRIPFGNTNLPVKEELAVSGSLVIRRVGLFDNNSGIFFTSTMDKTNEPALVMQQYSYKTVVYSEGADEKDYYTPFVASIEHNLKTVTTPDTPIISVRSDIEDTVWTFDHFKITAVGENLNWGAYIKIIYNADLPGSTFANPATAGSRIVYDTTATDATNGYVIYDGHVLTNQTIVIKKEDLRKIYLELFSQKEIQFNNGAINLLYFAEESLSIVATNFSNTTTLDLTASVVGGEIR